MRNLSLRFANKVAVRLLVLLYVASVSSGFSDPFGGGGLRWVDAKPFLDRPARLSFARFVLGKGGDTVSCVLANFEGQNLRAYSSNMVFEKPVAGKLSDVLKSVQEPYRYVLFEVRNRKGRVLGYIFAHEEGIDSYHLDILGEDSSLFIMGAEVTVD